MLEQQLDRFVNDNLPFDRDLLPPSAYLVGGAVRDALLNRHRDYLDLDFVLAENAISVARQIARYYKRGFVVLDDERQIARVIFEEGTIDFAQQEGETLEIDLKRRDFTINAIAYHLRDQTLIDPLQGLGDLEKGVLRMVSPDNLAEDPLRLLRAYRQAAQLHFTIQENTRSVIQQLAPLISQVAAERVQSELNYLLKNPQGVPWLILAWHDQLLLFWLPDITLDCLNSLQKVEKLYHDFYKKLHLHTNELDVLSLSKLTLLLSSCSAIAQTQLTDLKYARSEIRSLTNVVNYLKKLAQNKGLISLKDKYFLFVNLKNTFPILALSALALGIAETTVLSLIQHYQNPQDSLAHPHSIVTGHDLIESLDLKPSPLIGQLLTELQLAYIEGKIKTRQDAICYAAQMIINKP